MLQTTLYVIRLTLMLLGECKGNTTIVQRAYAQSPQGGKVVRTGCRITIGYSHSHYGQ